MDQNITVLDMLLRAQESLDRPDNSKFEFTPKSIAIEFVNFLCRVTPARKYEPFYGPMASLSIALEYGFLRTHDNTILDVLAQYFEKWDKTGNHIYFIDQIMNGYTLLFLYEGNSDDRVRERIRIMYKYLKEYPRTSSGGFPYRIKNPETVLVDYLGMICPFLSRLGKDFNCEEASNLATRLLQDFLCNGLDAKTGLPYHGFRSDTLEKLGVIGWGRGVGWLLIGLIDSLAYLDRSSDEFQLLSEKFKVIIDSTLSYQDEEGYFKWMLPAYEGHIDTSATAMIGYSVKRGIDLNILESGYIINAENALKAILISTEDGLIFDSLADCQGIGMYPQKYEWNRWGQGFGTAFALIMTESKD